MCLSSIIIRTRLRTHQPPYVTEVRQVQGDDRTAAELGPEAWAEMAADVDPEALTVMASADPDMAARLPTHSYA
jgi:hypothetical protein